MIQTHTQELHLAQGRYRRISAWVAGILALLWLVLGWLGAFQCTSCAPDQAAGSAAGATVMASNTNAAEAPLASVRAASVAGPALPTLNTSSTAHAVPACAPSMDVTVSFALGSAGLTPEGKAQLAALAPCIKGPTEIGGHSDSVGSLEGNMRLSLARAQAASSQLQSKGVKADWLSAKAYGPSQPVADNATPEGRQANRRITLVAR